MKAAFTVFVCSPFADLAPERQAVLEAIQRLKLQHDSMEFFGARAEQPIDTCLLEVRRSDILIVILGHRYGSIAPGLGISFSEAEYGEAIRLGKPCLVYIRADDVPILPKHMESDGTSIALLTRWKSSLHSHHTVARFRDASDLALQVAADLSRTIIGLHQEYPTILGSSSKSTDDIFTASRALITQALEAGASESAILELLQHSLPGLLPKSKTGDPAVFFSYSFEDREIVGEVAKRLVRSGVKVWLDEMSMSPAKHYIEEIFAKLDASAVFVFFISPSSIRSQFARLELDYVLEQSVRGKSRFVVIPVLLESTDVPPLLRQFSWLDMQDKDVNRISDRLVQEFRA